MVTKHKRILLEERESLIQAKQALEDEEAASRQTTQVTTPAHSVGQHGAGKTQDESAINSVNYSRRDNSVVTQPIAPGNMTALIPRALGNTIVIPPTVPASNTSGSNNEDIQDKEEDPELGTYIPNELGIPLLESPEGQQSLNLAETKARNLKYIGYFTGQTQWRTLTTHTSLHPRKLLISWTLCGNVGQEWELFGTNMGHIPPDAHVGTPQQLRKEEFTLDWCALPKQPTGSRTP
jgi:hypothetical protein